MDPLEIPDWQHELDRRETARREEDRSRHKTIIALVTLLVAVLSILVSVTASWVTSVRTLDSKVDKIEQIKTDAGLDARITVNAGKIDGIQQSLNRLQSSVDSANVRLRQIVCNNAAPSCR